MRIRLYLLVCLFAAILPSIASGASWSMFMWDPSHSSFNSAELLIDANSVGNLRPLGSFRADGRFSAPPPAARRRTHLRARPQALDPGRHRVRGRTVTHTPAQRRPQYDAPSELATRAR